jgi:hypothetical protein
MIPEEIRKCFIGVFFWIALISSERNKNPRAKTDNRSSADGSLQSEAP